MRSPVSGKIVLAATVAGVLAAQQQAVTLSQEKAKRIEQAIMTEMARRSIPGLTVAIGQGNQLRWEGAYGMADMENMVPMTTSTVLRTASLAKPITAVAAMQLVESGRLQLDVPIQRFLPAFPQKPWPVTLRHLLCHQAGIRTYQGDELQSTRFYRDMAESLRIFQNDPLAFEPGTRILYSTYGFDVIGATIEAVAGVDYFSYIRERILRPTKMTATEVDNAFRIIPRRARGYYMNATGTLMNASMADTSYKIPGGGMLSCPEDLVNFALAVGSNQLLKRETVQQVFTPQKLKDGKATGWGLGWEVEQTPEGRRRVGHHGGQQGVTTHLVMYPQEMVAIAVMVNLEQVPITQITDAIARIVFSTN